MTSAPILDKVLSALIAHDATSLPFASFYKATLNGKADNFKSGLWSSATKIGSYHFTLSDEDTNQHGFIGLIWRGEEASICGIRVGLNARNEITEMEIIQGRDTFPGPNPTDPRTLTSWRSSFSMPPPSIESRQRLADIALSYYEAVTRSDPSLVPMADEGSRVEMGNQINNLDPAKSKYNLTDGFYKPVSDDVKLPNFALWSAKEQFERGLWNADTVDNARAPIVDRKRGLVLAFSVYQPYRKSWICHAKGIGDFVPINYTEGEKRSYISLNMIELFEIKNGLIGDMESTWYMETETEGDVSGWRV